ncbi:hypothetical protein ACP70R_022429 [Stipagrostis hirtigluma subsp. patula]
MTDTTDDFEYKNFVSSMFEDELLSRAFYHSFWPRIFIYSPKDGLQRETL